jgi:hypothetical protein
MDFARFTSLMLFQLTLFLLDVESTTTAAPVAAQLFRAHHSIVLEKSNKKNRKDAGQR